MADIFWLVTGGLIVLVALVLGIAFIVWVIMDAYFPKCPHCGKRRAKHLREEVNQGVNAAYIKTGFDVWRCKACGQEFKIPFSVKQESAKRRRPKDDDDSSLSFGGSSSGGGLFDKGSWGGGSSAGGGASGKW